MTRHKSLDPVVEATAGSTLPYPSAHPVSSHPKGYNHQWHLLLQGLQDSTGSALVEVPLGTFATPVLVKSPYHYHGPDRIGSLKLHAVIRRFKFIEDGTPTILYREATPI